MAGKKSNAEDDALFQQTIAEDLAQTEGVAREVADADSLEASSWHRAREIVTRFEPVPSVIWRISNYVFGKPGETRTLSEGAVIGLKKLVCAIASDRSIGSGETVTTSRRALQLVPHDVLAAGAVMYGICRRLGGYDFERIWRPILDDAILRANIGYLVGERCSAFGFGRGMLAGFAGRSGLAVLIATGSMEQARQALEGLATGGDIALVGLKVYGCNPLQVSAMLLSASGAGKDAAFGSVSYALRERAAGALANEEQGRWLAVFSITEAIRMGRTAEIPPEHWALLALSDARDQLEILDRAKPLMRKGVGWGWLE